MSVYAQRCEGYEDEMLEYVAPSPSTAMPGADFYGVDQTQNLKDITAERTWWAQWLGSIVMAQNDAVATNIEDKCLLFDLDSVLTLEDNHLPSHLFDSINIQLTVRDNNQIVPIDVVAAGALSDELSSYVEINNISLELFYYPVDQAQVMAEWEASAALERSGQAEYGMAFLTKLISVYPGVINSSTQTYNLSIGGSIPRESYVYILDTW